MKILFIYSAAENIGIESLSSVLKSAGHTTHLLFDPAVFWGGVQFIHNRSLAKIFSVDEEIVEKAVALRPDIICFSAYTFNYRWCLKIAGRLKQLMACPIVFGGIHTSAAIEEVLSQEFIDYAIIGEGEYPLLELVEHLEKSTSKEELLKMPNLCMMHEGNRYINAPRPYIRDLDKLPFGDKELFYQKIPMLAKNYLTMTSRGCPFNCSYCCNSAYNALYSHEKNHVRRRSPQNVIEELKLAKKKWKLRLVSFADDVFTSSTKWLKEFIPLYKSEINIPFFCSAHPLSISREKAALLKYGGCWLITVGVQSGSEKLRREIFHRRGTNEQILESIYHIKNAGIKISLDNIFGAPTETVEDLEQTFELYNKAKVKRIFTFWLTYFPGTKIIDYARDYNCLSEKEIIDISRGNNECFHDRGSVKEGIETYRQFELKFQLRTLLMNDKLYAFACKWVPFLPFKGLAKKIIIFLNGIKNRDVRMFNFIEYLMSKKNVP